MSTTDAPTVTAGRRMPVAPRRAASAGHSASAPNPIPAATPCACGAASDGKQRDGERGGPADRVQHARPPGDRSQPGRGDHVRDAGDRQAGRHDPRVRRRRGRERADRLLHGVERRLPGGGQRPAADHGDGGGDRGRERPAGDGHGGAAFWSGGVGDWVRDRPPRRMGAGLRGPLRRPRPRSCRVAAALPARVELPRADGGLLRAARLLPAPAHPARAGAVVRRRPRAADARVGHPVRQLLRPGRAARAASSRTATVSASARRRRRSGAGPRPAGTSSCGREPW